MHAKDDGHSKRYGQYYYRDYATRHEQPRQLSWPFLRRDQLWGQWVGWLILYYHYPSLLGVFLFIDLYSAIHHIFFKKIGTSLRRTWYTWIRGTSALEP